MKRLHIIMPMGGEATRFKNVGCFTPKPLIKAKGTQFFERAVGSVLKWLPVAITCIVRKEHIDNYHIDKEIKKVYPYATILTVNETTRGAVETCMIARDYIKDDDTVIVLDCDLEFSCSDYDAELIKILRELSDADGLLVSFKSNEPRYSYAKAYNGIVDETAEKKPISDNALIGAYCFSRGDDFKHYASLLISHNDLASTKEFYTSLLYNYMLADEKKIILTTINKEGNDMYNSFGTPEELDDYER